MACKFLTPLLLTATSAAIIWAAFTCFLIAFVFMVFVFYRQRREIHFRQKEAELGRQVAEVEMKALRAQMNPHFIFNALNSVYGYMEKNDLQNAGEYLLKVSALMRRVLENSMHKSVSLEDDLGVLQLYIEIEQMRLQHSFSFNISVAADVGIENTFVPPLIAQPFVENAIWHGLKNRNNGGELSIRIYKGGEVLHYEIDDNGTNKGNTEAESETGGGVKKKSLGLNITRERLDVLNKTNNSSIATFSMADKWNEHNQYAGKKVTMQLPLEVL